MTNPKLSIVIGALREEKRIGKTLDVLSIFLKDEGLDKSTEVIVVVADGGDNTLGVVSDRRSSFESLRTVEPGKPVGKGRDIKAGMLASHGEVRLFMDADLATPLHHIKTVLAMFENESPDIIIGTRRLTKIHKDIPRQLISLLGNLCFMLVGGFYSPDTQCGFKAFTDEAANICFNKQTRMKWSFDMELLTIANVNKLRVQQIALNDWQDMPDGTFKPSLGSSLQFFKDLLKIFFKRILGKYKKK
ncbi:MAG: glycosyltransferase [Patescibacteria group bacterium]